MARTGPVRVFVSSPGDVIPERRIAREVIQRLDREWRALFSVEGIFWEQEPLVASEHFQAGITPPSKADIVVAILWSRLGQALPRSAFPGAVTGRTVTGTEYEWEDALAGWKERGWPAVLFYRKVADAAVNVTDAKKRRAATEALDRLDDFIARWFQDPKTGEYKHAYREFTTSDELSELLHAHLVKLLKRRVRAPVGTAREPRPVVAWHEGNPFRGLLGFSFEHQAIFFGRTRSRNELREALLRQARARCAFVTVVGASGSGKSSLVKAGLLPDVTTPGLVEGVGLFRYAVLRPGDPSGDPAAALAASLFAAPALPELQATGHDEQTLATLFRQEVPPDVLLGPIRGALAQAARGRGLLPGADARLAIVVDQLEELLTQAIAPDDRDRFVAVLEALARSGLVWVIATLRSDFLARCEQVARLVPLTSGAASWVLHPPTGEEIGQMVRLPAEAAGLRFDVDRRTGQHLDEAIRREAEASTASLPLMQYLLAQLWESRTRAGHLTFAAYRRLGGLSGVLGRRADEVLRRLAQDVRAELPPLLRALVTIAPGEHTPATARSASLAAFPDGTPRHALLSAFLDPSARLLVADGDQIRVAHESLLTHWSTAADLITKDRADLQARSRIEQDWRTWREGPESAKDSLLLPAGLPLDEAEDLLQRREDDFLSPELRDYIQRSRGKHKAEVARLDWLRLRAEAASLLSRTEESFARAQRNEALAGRVETQPNWPERPEYLASLRDSAGKFRELGQKLWTQAYARQRDLRSHPGAPAEAELRQAPADAVLRLEMIEAGFGICLLLHYGTRGDPRYVLVDSGDPGALPKGLKPRLQALLAGSRKRRLALELALVTHGHYDRWGGLWRLLAELARSRTRHIEVRRLWFNNVVPIGVKGSDTERRRADALVLRARRLGIAVNRPFDHFVMPSEIGPARVLLDGGLSATIVAPSRQNMERLVRISRSTARRVEGDPPTSLVDQLGGVLSEGFSSPEITLLRAPPDLPPEPARSGSDEMRMNDTSLVTVLEVNGRRLLFPGDAHGDDILYGLRAAGYLVEGERLHLDCLVLPHFGLAPAVSNRFLSTVTADHYVVQGTRRWMVPRPDLVHALAKARGTEPFTLHVGLGVGDEAVRKKLDQAIAAQKGAWKGVVRFRPAPGKSLFVDLLAGPEGAPTARKVSRRRVPARRARTSSTR